MLRLAFMISAVVFLTACQADESITKYADPSADYQLVEVDGAAFDALATISFPQSGRVEGQAPCNRYFATQTAPYPWFALEQIGATRMACPDLASESVFFDALGAMTLAEVSGPTLILSNSAGRQMVFVAR